jgi:antitoxin component YwqK of YwqJK toxin-antitoxin module
MAIIRFCMAPVPIGTKLIPLAGAVLFGFALSLGWAEDVHSVRTFHPNGKVMETYQYRLALREGKQPDTLLMGERILWDSTTGRKLYMTNYRDGKKDGVAIDWYPGGSVRYRCYYRLGIADSSSLWDENGGLLERAHFHYPDHDTLFRYDRDGSYQILIPPGYLD